MTEVRLFGSRSRGDYREDSDFDLLITDEERVSLLDVGCFVYDLEETLVKPVGISFKDSASEMFLKAIAPDLKEIYVREQSGTSGGFRSDLKFSNFLGIPASCYPHL